MSGTRPSRQLPIAAASAIEVVGGSRSAAYASYWLRLLGAPAAAADEAKIVITGGDRREDAAQAHPNADCVIRLWDFQVGRRGNGVLASAVSGASAVIGHPGKPPPPLPADMPEKWCALYGVILALAEIWRRRNGNEHAPVVYDVSAADVLRAFSLQNAGDRNEMVRSWRRNGRLCIEHGGIFPMGFFACRDGHVAVLGRSRRDWRNIRRAIGDPDWATAGRFENPFEIARDSSEADALLEASLAAFSRDELLRRGLAAGAVIAPVYSQAEAHQRGIFRQGFITDDGPEMPFLVDHGPSAHGARGTPMFPRSEIAPFEAADAPLAGLRCIELAWVWSGPMVGQILADLGAEVIKVESPARFDLYRTRGLEAVRGQMPERTRIESSIYFHSLNRNKIGLALNLKQPKGLGVMKRLAARSELLLENFTVGTMARLGLGSEALAQANPALVQLSMSGPGRGSAVQDLRSYGLVLSALAGAESLIEDDGDFLGPPTFSISDPNAAAFGAIAALAGVLAASEDGHGRQMDLSQIEAAATLAGAPSPAPTDLSAIIEFRDGLSAAVSVPAGAFADEVALRHAFEGLTHAEAIERCKTFGGEMAEVLELEQTDDAAVFAECPGRLPSTHPTTGAEMLVAAPWRVNGRRPPVRNPAPVLGADDDYVLNRVLNMAEDEADALAAGGAVGVPDHE